MKNHCKMLKWCAVSENADTGSFRVRLVVEE